MGQDLETASQLPGDFGFFERGDEVGQGAVVNSAPALSRGNGEADGQMGFSDARGPEEDDVLLTLQEAEFVEAVETCLVGMGYAVTIDDPYKGVELVRRYSDPLRGRHSMQIEINRGLYMDEATISRSAGFPMLKENIGRLVETICEYGRARIGARRY